MDNDVQLQILTPEQITSINNNEYSYYTKNEKGIEQQTKAFIDYTTFWIQAPTEGVNEDTTFCIVQGGDGGVLSDAKGEYISAQGKNELLITTNSLKREDYNKSEAIIEDMAASSGANPRNRVYMGHSISGDLVTNRAAEYIMREREEDNQTRTVVVLNDASGLKPLFNPYDSEKDDKIDSLNDSLVIGSVQTKYFNEHQDGTITIKKEEGMKLGTYNEDLEDIAKAGGSVLLVAYNIQEAKGDAHTESVGISAALGFDSPSSAMLLDSPFTILTKEGTINTCNHVDYYYFDTNSNQWTKFKDLESAQNYYNYAEGKVELYNSGFLEKKNDVYYIKTPDGLQEVSSMDLERMILDFKNADPDEVKDMTLYEYIQSKGFTNYGDSEEHTLEKVERGVDSLAETLGEIHVHMDSLTSVNGLNSRGGDLSSFISKGGTTRSFPSGVNTSGFNEASECVKQFGTEIANAYNIAVDVRNAVATAEGNASVLYHTEKYSYNSSHQNTQTFANDVTYVK